MGKGEGVVEGRDMGSGGGDTGVSRLLAPFPERDAGEGVRADR